MRKEYKLFRVIFQSAIGIMQVQELMGHQSYETTLQYSHLSEDHSKREVLKLPFANGHDKATARIRHAEANYVDTLKNEKPCETASSQGL